MVRRYPVAIPLVAVFATVLAASLFGILTRPLGFLAAFWPANAILLGLFVRWPGLASPLGWIAATAGYLAADLLTGDDPILTTWLTAANLAGVATGVVLFGRLSEDDRLLRRPTSVLYLLGIVTIAAAVAAAIGGGAAPVFFGGDLISGLAFWFSTELVNGIIILPAVLTVPALSTISLRRRRPSDLSTLVRKTAPIAAVVALTFLGLAIGGPWSIAYPSPALLWVALTLGVFPTAVLTMLVGVWHMVAFSLGLYTPYAADIDLQTVSDRLGITLLALGPLTVASVDAARKDLIRRLEALATFDALTGSRSRAAFLETGTRLVEEQPAPEEAVSVLMLDLDDFKQINDNHGHAVGDRALQAFARAVSGCLRETDLFGRLGGEEFAVVLPGALASSATALAERLRSEIAALRIPIGPHVLRMTVSIGVATRPPGSSLTLAQLLLAADFALYGAKSEGRNQVVVADTALPPPAQTGLAAG